MELLDNDQYKPLTQRSCKQHHDKTDWFVQHRKAHFLLATQSNLPESNNNTADSRAMNHPMYFVSKNAQTILRTEFGKDDI